MKKKLNEIFDEAKPQETFEKDEFRIIGEAYNTYIFAEFADKIGFTSSEVDKILAKVPLPRR